MRDLPFGIWFAARTEAVFGLLYFVAGVALYAIGDSLSGTPTFFGSVSEGTVAFLGIALCAIGTLDLLTASSLATLSTGGFIAAMLFCAISVLLSALLITMGFTMVAMNLFLNIAVPTYLMKWDVRQEYIPR